MRLRAERRAGTFLSKLEKNRGGDRKSNSQAAKLVSPYRVAIDSAGIDKDAASRYQQVAAVPEPKFSGYLKEAREATTRRSARGQLLQ